MNQERFNFRDLLEDSTDCLSTALNKRRKWSPPTDIRKYHDLALLQNHTGTLTQNLLKDLSTTKRHVSELIEKNKMTEWLKKNTIKCGSKPDDLYDPNSDSGVSLCPSVDKSKGSTVRSSSSLSTRKGDKKCNFRYGNASHSKATSNDDERLLKSGLSNPDNDGKCEEKKEFYTPRSCWEEEKQIDSSSKSNSQGSELKPSRQFGANKASSTTSLLSVTQSKNSTSRPNSPSLDSEETESIILEGDISLSSLGSPLRSPNPDENSDISLTYSSTSIVDLEGGLGLPETSPNFNTILNADDPNNTFPIACPAIADSLMQLTKLKTCNKNAVANFLKNLTSSSDLSYVPTEYSGDGSVNTQQDSSSDENIFKIPSNESLRWNFPNSNRKREEKLRSIGKDVAGFDISSRNLYRNMSEKEVKTNGNKSQFSRNTNVTTDDPLPQTSCDNKLSNAEFKISYTAEGCIKKMYDEKIQRYNKTITKTNVVNVGNCDGYSERRINVESVRDMNTHAALIYLSETLIESAQRAEMLLMQKMKEYNDLVCRDPPEKKKQDVSCQIKVEEQHQKEALFEGKLIELKYKHEMDLKEKNDKIMQLEMEKKKLRQALKKMNLSVVKKCDVSTSGNLDIDMEPLTPKSHSSESSTVKYNSANDEFVQALKIENNLLHTLLKEMKAELDQESATILSLAKKLEMSLGKQSGSKSKQQTEVVRKLETKLEQQEKLLKQEAMEARAVAKYVIMKYKKLIQEYKQKVKSHQETVDKLTNAIK